MTCQQFDIGDEVSFVHHDVTLHGRVVGAELVDDRRRRGGTDAELRMLIDRALLRGVGLSRIPRRRDDQQQVLLRCTLSSTSKLVLLVVWLRLGPHTDGTADRLAHKLATMTADSVASDAGLHRITAQRTLAALRRDGVLRDKWIIHWPTLASYAHSR